MTADRHQQLRAVSPVRGKKVIDGRDHFRCSYNEHYLPADEFALLSGKYLHSWCKACVVKERTRVRREKSNGQRSASRFLSDKCGAGFNPEPLAPRVA